VSETEDALLGGRVRLIQPKDGFRAAIDAVLMAAAVPAGAGDRILELGAGNGAAALCLAERVAGAGVSGLEVQADLALLAGRNAALNGKDGRVAFIAGDVLDPPPELAGPFDHVMANPPYLDPARANLPPDGARARATVEGAATLEDWLQLAFWRVGMKGTVTLIHRADRIDEIMAGLHGRLGALTIFPLWPAAGVAAKRVIVQGRKGSNAPARILPGLVLHGAGGAYTAEAEAVLRAGAPLEL